MRHNDFAYRWLVEIRHNSDPPVPGRGQRHLFSYPARSDRPTAGCTTMAERDLVRLDHLAARAAPSMLMRSCQHEIYEEKWQEWNLPAPELWKLP